MTLFWSILDGGCVIWWYLEDLTLAWNVSKNCEKSNFFAPSPKCHILYECPLRLLMESLLDITLSLATDAHLSMKSKYKTAKYFKNFFWHFFRAIFYNTHLPMDHLIVTFYKDRQNANSLNFLRPFSSRETIWIVNRQ